MELLNVAGNFIFSNLSNLSKYVRVVKVSSIFISSNSGQFPTPKDKTLVNTTFVSFEKPSTDTFSFAPLHPKMVSSSTISLLSKSSAEDGIRAVAIWFVSPNAVALMETSVSGAINSVISSQPANA